MKTLYSTVCLSSLVLAGSLLTACVFDGEKEQPEPLLTDGDYRPTMPVAPPGWPQIAWPSDNPYSSAKAILGRRLFFDRNLSLTRDRACSWCHDPNAAFSDPRHPPLSVGVGQGVTTRNSPVVFNMAFARSFMLDGRSASLEEQALGPLFAHNEMAMTEAEIVTRLTLDSAYTRLFAQAYGDADVTLARVTRALATYQRTLISVRSPYDRWREGDSTALTAAAKRGFMVFMNPENACASCHTPPLFTDGGFHAIGLDSIFGDSGRANATGRVEDVGKFKTPTLRHLVDSWPYMHDGRFRDLAAVVDHYNRGGVANAVADARIKPLGLSPAAVNDLIAFLEALTDSNVLATPAYVP